MSKASFGDLLEKCRVYWRDNKGCEEWVPAGLCPSAPIFKNTFNPSATHAQISAILTGEMEWRHSSYFVIETVYRHVDIGAVGDTSHFSIFKMLGVVKLLPPHLDTTELQRQRNLFIEEVISFLREIGIRPDNLVSTYFHGGALLERMLPADDGFKQLMLSLGCRHDNIVGVGGTFAFLLNAQYEVDVAGYRNDLYYKCPHDNLLEIATLDFAEYLSSRGILLRRNDKFTLLGFYTGIERLAATQEDGDVWNVREFRDLLNNRVKMLQDVYKYPHGNYITAILGRDLKVFVDRLRAITHIFLAGQTPDNSDRGQMLKRLIQDVIRISHNYMGRVDPEFINSAISEICLLDGLDASCVAHICQEIKNRERRKLL